MRTSNLLPLMKTPRLFLSLLIILALSAFRLPSTSYHALPSESRLTWTGYAETGAYAPTGTVQLREGTLEYDGRVVRRARFEVDMRTIQHEQATLAEHLRGADFFATDRYPTAVFVLREFRAGTALGQLTVRGVTRPVTFPVTLTPLPAGRLRLTGVATLDRTEFGVNYNSSSFFQNLGSYAIRNDFKLAIDVVAAR